MYSVSRMKWYLRPTAGVLFLVLAASAFTPAGAQILGSGEKVPGMINNEASITMEPKERPIGDVLDHIRDIVGVNIFLAPGIDETITLTLNDVPWRDALHIVADEAGCIVIEKSSKIFRVEKPPRVTFSFIDEDVKLVINAIATAAGADVIIAPEVEGKVNMHVDNIPWKDALSNVIKTMGYHMVEEDRGVLRVVTTDSLQEQLETRIFELKYVRPKNTYVPIIDTEYILGENKPAEGDSRKDFPLLTALESLLSKSGKLDYFPKENVIFVKDIKPNLDKIGEIIERLDQEPLQVEIDVQFITLEKRDTFDASFGFAGLDGNGIRASWNGAKRTDVLFPFNVGDGGFGDNILPGGTTGVTPGVMDFSPIQFLVQLIEVSTNTRITQTPRIVTLDHHEATINVGDEIRWAVLESSSSQSGGVEFTLKEADDSPKNVGFQLYVTPHIIPGTNKIAMSVIPYSTTLNGTSTELEGFDKFTVGSGGNLELFLPRVKSQTLVTNLLIESGQTCVIGGLVTNRETEILTKVPWLGDIPYLGLLFRSKSTLDVNEELLVFLTPRIVQSGSDVNREVEKLMNVTFTDTSEAFKALVEPEPEDAE